MGNRYSGKNSKIPIGGTEKNWFGLKAGPEEEEKQAQSPTQQQRKQKDKAAASQLGLETCPHDLV